MGKGKGRINSWVCNIHKGSVILEIDNLPFNESYKVLKLAAQKLPGPVSIVFR
jgi:ribosomal protein L16/L10AE